MYRMNLVSSSVENFKDLESSFISKRIGDKIIHSVPSRNNIFELFDENINPFQLYLYKQQSRNKNTSGFPMKISLSLNFCCFQLQENRHMYTPSARRRWLSLWHVHVPAGPSTTAHVPASPAALRTDSSSGVGAGIISSGGRSSPSGSLTTWRSTRWRRASRSWGGIVAMGKTNRWWETRLPPSIYITIG